MLGIVGQRRLLPFALLFFAACGSSVKTQVRSTTPKVPVSAPAVASSKSATADLPNLGDAQTTPVTDPVLVLIAASDRHFTAGQTELEQGHFERARQQFNKSVDVLLESPYGGRTEPRIREHFDRLVDRISAYEMRALATGDGFTEMKYEPATIDELLAVSS